MNIAYLHVRSVVLGCKGEVVPILPNTVQMQVGLGGKSPVLTPCPSGSLAGGVGALYTMHKTTWLKKKCVHICECYPA